MTGARREPTKPGARREPTSPAAKRDPTSPSPARRPPASGRFGDFDVLSQVDHWDDVTARVVLARLDPGPPAGFFEPQERATAGALLDLLLDQPEEEAERPQGAKVPVLALVEARLAADETDGWFYEDLPEDRQAWRETLAGLDADAGALHGCRFVDLPLSARAEIVQAVQEASLWRGFDAGHVWSLWTRYACAAFYSHPWAWSEIGFGGPAYPRGYKALAVGLREPWETPDREPEDDPIREGK